jgi:short-subunit dehydrogenase
MNERTALITGASMGMGRRLAERLAARDTTVVLCANTAKLLAEVRDGIESNGGHAIALTLDVRDTGSVIEAVQRMDRELEGLDLVVANAGISNPTAGKDITWEAIAPVFHVNVLGAIATLTAALPGMLRRGKGHLAAVSSIAGYRGLPTVAHYCASKAALSIFLEGLRFDLAGSGIDVTDIQPGFVDSDGTGRRKYATPMSMDLESAVDHIVAAIDRKARVAAFPRTIAALFRISRFLPQRLYERIIRRAFHGHSTIQAPLEDGR